MTLFFQNAQLINSAAHDSLRLKSFTDFRFAAETNSIPLAADELFAAEAHYPIVLPAMTRRSQSQWWACEMARIRSSRRTDFGGATAPSRPWFGDILSHWPR
jgi:hypothetical protein